MDHSLNAFVCVDWNELYFRMIVGIYFKKLMSERLPDFRNLTEIQFNFFEYLESMGQTSCLRSRDRISIEHVFDRYSGPRKTTVDVRVSIKDLFNCFFGSVTFSV